MRPLKFRAWNRGKLEHFDLHNITVPDRALMSGEHPVQQYTGLNDKNGKEIYEGDIVKYDDSDISTKPITGIAEVIYNTDLTLTPSPCFGLWFIRNPSFNSPRAGFYQNMFAFMEVIGNIYENKELLNETN